MLISGLFWFFLFKLHLVVLLIEVLCMGICCRILYLAIRRARNGAVFEQKKAYNTLEENIHLKRKLARHTETMRELRMMQRRLSYMLDAIPDPLLAVNEVDEISFTNLLFQSSLGYSADELLGIPLAEVTGNDTWQAEIDMTCSDRDDRENTRFLEIVEFKRKDTSVFQTAVLFIPIEHDDSLLWMMVLRPQGELPEVNGEWSTGTDRNTGELVTP